MFGSGFSGSFRPLSPDHDCRGEERWGEDVVYLCAAFSFERNNSIENAQKQPRRNNSMENGQEQLVRINGITCTVTVGEKQCNTRIISR